MFRLCLLLLVAITSCSRAGRIIDAVSQTIGSTGDTQRGELLRGVNDPHTGRLWCCPVACAWNISPKMHSSPPVTRIRQHCPSQAAAAIITSVPNFSSTSRHCQQLPAGPGRAAISLLTSTYGYRIAMATSAVMWTRRSPNTCRTFATRGGDH